MVCGALLLASCLAGLCLAQQETASLRAQTDLVTVPFQVRRGSRSVADLKASDVVLLEDGAPRAFSVFEPPSEHPSLELVALFDVTRRAGEERNSSVFWDEKALQRRKLQLAPKGDQVGPQHWHLVHVAYILYEPCC